jgi:hypothetical protein
MNVRSSKFLIVSPHTSAWADPKKLEATHRHCLRDDQERDSSGCMAVNVKSRT